MTVSQFDRFGTIILICRNIFRLKETMENAAEHLALPEKDINYIINF